MIEDTCFVKVRAVEQLFEAEKKRLEKILWLEIEDIKAECDNGENK